MLRGGALTWTNWDGQQSCSPSAIVNVTTVADVVAAVTAAAGRPIRALGFGHSFSPIDLSDGGVLINLVPPPVSQVRAHFVE